MRPRVKSWMALKVRPRLKAWLALTVALLSEVGMDEIVLTLALVLLARGCWLVWQPGAYLVPGTILLWIALPERKSFVSRVPPKPEKPMRRIS